MKSTPALSLVALLSLAACSGSPTGADGSSPQVAITAPVANAVVGGQVSIDIAAIDDYGVDKVRVLVDGVLLQEIYTAPYHVVWNTAALANGSAHTIRVEAFDVAKNIGVSQILVTVQNGVQ